MFSSIVNRFQEYKNRKKDLLTALLENEFEEDDETKAFKGSNKYMQEIQK